MTEKMEFENEQVLENEEETMETYGTELEQPDDENTTEDFSEDEDYTEEGEEDYHDEDEAEEDGEIDAEPGEDGGELALFDLDDIPAVETDKERKAREAREAKEAAAAAKAKAAAIARSAAKPKASAPVSNKKYGTEYTIYYAGHSVPVPHDDMTLEDIREFLHCDFPELSKDRTSWNTDQEEDKILVPVISGAKKG